MRADMVAAVRRWSSRAAALFGIPLLAVCGQNDSRSGMAGDLPRWRLSEAIDLSIGGSDERPGYALTYPAGAALLSDGGVVVADNARRELHYYDSGGVLLRTVGGSGEGPGELQGLIHSFVRMRGDTIALWEAAARRASVFAPDGQHAYTVSSPGWSAAQTTIQQQSPQRSVGMQHAFLVDSEYVVVDLLSVPDPERLTGSVLIQDTLPLRVLYRSRPDWLELGNFPGVEFFFDDRASTLSVPALGERLRVAASSDVVYAAASRDTLISILSPVTGQVVGSIRMPWERRIPSPADLAEVERRLLDGMSGQDRVRIQRYVDALPSPDSLPMFSDLRVGADQRVWIQKYRAPADEIQEWMVFEASGEAVASFVMDADTQMLDTDGERILVQTTNELDVPRITRHRLKSAPADR